MSINRVLNDIDRLDLQSICLEMQSMWPELFSRKISDSMVQFAFCYKTVMDFLEELECQSVLCAGSHEDIVSESLKYHGACVLDIDPVFNSDLHTFYTRHGSLVGFQIILSASVLEHTENDEEFVSECCKMLMPGGYGVFTMDFKADWKPGEKVPYTSNRFYTPEDLTGRLRSVLRANNCDLIEEPDYSATDRFVYDGINYGFATWVFRKDE